MTIDRTVTLTGIKPTGELHLGNYAGAILPLSRLAAGEHREVYAFVADLHALNGRPEPAALAERTRRLAAALLACGLDRPNVHLYRQSRLPAVAGSPTCSATSRRRACSTAPTPTRPRSPRTPRPAASP